MSSLRSSTASSTAPAGSSVRNISGKEFAAKIPLRLIHLRIRIGLVHGESFERLARPALGDPAGLFSGVLQVTAQIRGKSCHRITGPSLSLCSTYLRASASHWSSSVQL